MRLVKTYEQYLIENINEGVLVEPSRYVRVHGKKPKGRGVWAFEINSENIFTPRAMQYSDAVKWIKDEAKKKGISVVYTLG